MFTTLSTVVYDKCGFLCVLDTVQFLPVKITCTSGYNEIDFFLENKEYRPFDGCKIEI
jgi:hypothetical protein